MHLAETLPRLWNLQCATACPVKRIRVETVDVPPEVQACFAFDAMRAGGYPFGPDDLTVEQWMVLGIIATEREAQWRKSASGSF